MLPAVGFLILFGLYHAAEYMIVFQGSATGFLAFQALFFMTAWGIAKWQFGTGFAAWALDFRKGFFKHLLLGMVLGVLLYGLTFAISTALGVEKVTSVPGMRATLGPLGLFIFGNFFSSLSEDVFTRAYLCRHLHGKIRAGLLIMLSAAIFLLNHIYRLGGPLETHLYLFLLGVLLFIPLLYTKRLWFTTGVHWAGNVTFYITHEVLKAAEGNKHVSANYIFIGVLLLMIPVQYGVLQAFGFTKAMREPDVSYN